MLGTCSVATLCGFGASFFILWLTLGTPLTVGAEFWYSPTALVFGVVFTLFIWLLLQTYAVVSCCWWLICSVRQCICCQHKSSDVTKSNDYAMV